MFDTFYDLTTLDGTLKYCKSRNYFLPSGVEPKHPYRSVDKTSRGYTYIKDEIFDLTDDSNFSCVYEDKNPVMPFTPCYNSIDDGLYTSSQAQSPVKVSLSVNDNKYNITYSNIRNNNIYGNEMYNKKIDIDLFDELAYHYKQRFNIKQKSKMILDNVKPNNIIIEKGDLVKINKKILCVVNFNHRTARYEMKNLDTLKIDEYNLNKMKFSIILPKKLKKSIENFNITSLRKIQTNDESDNISMMSLSSIDTDLSIESCDNCKKDEFNFIENYFEEYSENESIYKLSENTSPKIVVHDIESEPTDTNYEKSIENIDNLDDNTDEKNENTGITSMCVVM